MVPQKEKNNHEDDDNRLGHLRRKPSNQRMYRSSAMGDLVLGNAVGSGVSGGVSL